MVFITLIIVLLKEKTLAIFICWCFFGEGWWRGGVGEREPCFQCLYCCWPEQLLFIEQRERIQDALLLHFLLFLLLLLLPLPPPPPPLALSWHCAAGTRPPYLASEPSRAYLEVLRHGSCPLISLSSQHRVSIQMATSLLAGLTAAGTTA